jgi:hypothetical protein
VQLINYFKFFKTRPIARRLCLAAAPQSRAAVFFMKNKWYNKNMKLKIFKKQSGTILFMAIMILTVMLTISLGAANLMMSGIVMSGTQARSVKAYFLADSGIEQALYEIRKTNNIATSSSDNLALFQNNNPFGDTFESYKVGYSTYNNFYGHILTSAGSCATVKRTVEVRY